MLEPELNENIGLLDVQNSVLLLICSVLINYTNILKPKIHVTNRHKSPNVFSCFI